MIKNLEGTALYISYWLQTQATEARAKSLVLGLSGGVDSALVAALCTRTKLPVIGVRMPCHSSPDSLQRAQEVVEALGVQVHTVNLEDAFDSIARQLPMLKESQDRHCSGALRSCLRAPTLDYVGKIYQGLIVGTGNRDEDEVTRYFQKRGDGCVDISPIAKLHKSEVYQLAEYLHVPDSVLKATPSADLWGPDAGQTDEGQLGMTYAEVEWGIRQAQAWGEVTREAFDRAMEYHTEKLSARQIKVLETLGDMEEVSRHKANPALPVCEVRKQAGLVE